jgi:hypothetical protein
MSKKAQRDAFSFSLMGLRATASVGPAVVIADDRFDCKRDDDVSGGLVDQPDTLREFENFLARYFAPACCERAA